MSAKKMTRGERWSLATGNARAALDDLQSALAELVVVQEEYQSWRDNLPENLQQSALGEKLDAVSDLELNPDYVLSDVESAIDEAESLELPLGFGRD